MELLPPLEAAEEQVSRGTQLFNSWLPSLRGERAQTALVKTSVLLRTSVLEERQEGCRGSYKAQKAVLELI